MILDKGLKPELYTANIFSEGINVPSTIKNVFEFEHIDNIIRISTINCDVHYININTIKSCIFKLSN